jgi:hypothetical protein
MFIKTLLLTGVLSLAATAVVYASDGPGGPTDGTSRSHASAVPPCGYECPVLAGDGGPGGINDGNGRSSAALSKGGAKFLVASIRGGTTGDF